jgi:hypothetical protein
VPKEALVALSPRRGVRQELACIALDNKLDLMAGFSGFPFDLILMDVQMGNLGSYLGYWEIAAFRRF